ncbi:hypothetical protein GRF29_216g257627 [Pseudopithomyces chartarum]|uniref:Uncharacterized protein n=1 Tax=Pseudopithomyces chartarum TaxID=1892770 RepID=A0AAN6LLU5_9PLEO|nr:hypothetical protein GRF29_216g257627 [Pseudopithomyces chartarum]
MRVNISSLLLVCLTAVHIGAVAVPVKNGDLTLSLDSTRRTTALSYTPATHGAITLSPPATIPTLSKRAGRKKATSKKSRPKKTKKKSPPKKKKTSTKKPTKTTGGTKTRPKKPKTPTTPSGTSKTKPKKPKATQSGVPLWKTPVPSLSEISKQCRVPTNKALFWSRTAIPVKAYRAQKGFTTDSQAYPKGYTSRYRGKDAKKDALFAKRFSIAFAMKAKGVVHLMVPWEGGPPAERVFHKDEWPVLKRALKRGTVTKIIQVNPDNYAETKIYDPKEYGLTKRGEEVDLKNVPWDVNIDALRRAWGAEDVEE